VHGPEDRLRVTRKNAKARFGTAPPFDGPTTARLAAAHLDSDGPFMDCLIAYIANVTEVDPPQGWSQLAIAFEYMTDQDQLCYLGLSALERFILDYPDYVADRWEQVRGLPGFHAAVSCAFAFSEPPASAEPWLAIAKGRTPPP
jgi:hypothetical protein